MAKTVGFEIITPDIARELLATSEGNRRIRMGVVHKYARDMLQNNWQDNGETISISESGHLKNGHHRLNAVIESGCSVEFTVRRGVPDDVDIFDKGVSRSTSDNFKFAGLEPWAYQNAMVALAKFCLNIVLGNSIPSDSEVKDFMFENEDSFKFAYNIYCSGNHNGRTQRFQRKAPLLAALFYAHKSGVSESTLLDFMRVLNTGLYSDNRQLSGIVLRNWLLSGPSIATFIERRDLFFKTQEAIASYDEGYPRKAMFRGTTGIYSDKYKK